MIFHGMFRIMQEIYHTVLDSPEKLRNESSAKRMD